MYVLGSGTAHRNVYGDRNSLLGKLKEDLEQVVVFKRDRKDSQELLQLIKKLIIMSENRESLWHEKPYKNIGKDSLLTETREYLSKKNMWIKKQIESSDANKLLYEEIKQFLDENKTANQRREIRNNLRNPQPLTNTSAPPTIRSSYAPPAQSAPAENGPASAPPAPPKNGPASAPPAPPKNGPATEPPQQFVSKNTRPIAKVPSKNTSISSLTTSSYGNFTRHEDARNNKNNYTGRNESNEESWEKLSFQQRAKRGIYADCSYKGPAALGINVKQIGHSGDGGGIRTKGPFAGDWHALLRNPTGNTSSKETDRSIKRSSNATLASTNIRSDATIASRISSSRDTLLSSMPNSTANRNSSASTTSTFENPHRPQSPPTVATEHLGPIGPDIRMQTRFFSRTFTKN